jgi:hypothetical protein
MRGSPNPVSERRVSFEGFSAAPSFFCFLHSLEGSNCPRGHTVALQAFSPELGRQQSVFSGTTQWGSFSIWSIL